MRVLVACSLGGAGHFHPLVPFLADMERRGDEALVVGPASLQAMIDAAGYRFWPGGEPSEDTTAPIREQLPTAPAAEASLLANRELFGRLATDALLPEMANVFAKWTPGFALREPTEYASAVIALRTGTPAAQVGISLADVEAGSIRVAAPALEAHEKGLVEALWTSPYLTRFPASLDPSPFPTTVRYREVQAAPGRQVLPDWWRGSQAPLVYLTFGTVLGYMSFAAEVYRVALASVGGLGIRVLLTVGRQFDASVLGPLPANVHVEPWVDQAVVLPHADLVVCHGGSGTALAALAAGVPLVVVPVFADQFENGRRIVAAGAGRIVEQAAADPHSTRHPPRAADAPRIAESIVDVLADGGYRSHARRLASEIAAMPTVADACRQVICPSQIT